MENNFINILLPIIGGSLGTLMITFIAHKMNLTRMKLQLEMENKYKERKDFKLMLEELYLLVDEWATSFSHLYLPIIQVMKNEITYNEALEYFISNQKIDKTNFKRIEMMINLYFSELKTEFYNVLILRDKINNIVDEHKRDYKNGLSDGTNYLKPFIIAQEKFYKSIEEFKNSISMFSKSILESKL